ncbi:MAG: hypothetical protein HDR37_10840 [Treponema sp.]|nr:hypothetical protein [Treponema sp.]
MKQTKNDEIQNIKSQKMKKGKNNIISIVSLVFAIYSLSVILAFIVFVCLDSDVFLLLMKKYGKTRVESLSTLQNIYSTAFIGLLAAYFTVLSIFLGRRQQLGFKTAMKYMLKPNHFSLHFVVMLINFFLVEFSFSVYKFSPFIELYTEDAILQILCCFAIGVINMVYMEEISSAAKLLRSFVIKDMNKAERFFKDFVSNSFLDSKFEVLLEAFDCNDIKEKEVKFRKLLQAVDLTDGKASDYEKLVDVIVKELYNLFAQNKEKIDFESIHALYEILYATITQCAYSNLLTHSFLLLAREPLFYYVDRLGRKAIPDKAESLINEMIDNYKRIILVSMHNCGYEIVREEISHFMEISQILRIHNVSNRLCKKHTKYIVDLITWIFNLIQFKKISSQYFIFIPSMLVALEYDFIAIFDVDTELYSEGVNPGTMHQIIYTRNYYIAMLFLYCETTKKYRTDKFLKKLRYEGISSKKEGWEYKYILQGLKDIIESDFISIMPEYKDEFPKAKKTIDDLLNEKISNIREKQMEERRKNIDHNKIEAAFSKQKDELLAEFNGFSEKSKDYEQLLPIQTELTVSYRELENDKSVHIYRSSQYPWFFNLLYDFYTKDSSFKIVNIETLLELPGKENDTLFVPHKFYPQFYRIKEIDFSERNTIVYSGKEFNIEFVHSEYDYIILKSDFNKAFAKPEINDSASRIQEEETDMDINFSMSVDLIFSCNSQMIFTAYEVEQLRIERNESYENNEDANE